MLPPKIDRGRGKLLLSATSRSKPPHSTLRCEYVLCQCILNNCDFTRSPPLVDFIHLPESFNRLAVGGNHVWGEIWVALAALGWLGLALMTGKARRWCAYTLPKVDTLCGLAPSPTLVRSPFCPLCSLAHRHRKL